MRTKQYSSNTLLLSIDVIAIAFVACLMILTIVFDRRITNAQNLLLDFTKAGVLYLFASFTSRYLPERISVVVRIVTILSLVSSLFQAIAPLQLIFTGRWMDDVLLSLERSITGTEMSVYLQRFVHPALTEWFMFSYVMYIPLLPITAIICYQSGGSKGVYDYLFHLLLVNIICNAGFILFPIASQMYYSPHQYTVPLQGGFFTWCGEWMRSNVHFPGGSLPSPHCAVGTVMLMMLYRYNRKALYITAPVLISIYAATVYGRYHYIWDCIAGIIAAVIVLKTAPVLITALQNAVAPLQRKLVPHFSSTKS